MEQKNGVATQSIVEEYQSLLERSQSLFSGLGDLPQFGSRLWAPFFQTAFEGFSKLWSFQQRHRQLLEDSERYGLKRWEVGEIASRIGQLYYQYYLRTSDVRCLWQSYQFFDAIRARGFFDDVLESKSPALIQQALWFLARFVLVALLLEKPHTAAAAASAATVFSSTVCESMKRFSMIKFARIVEMRDDISRFCEVSMRNVEYEECIRVRSPGGEVSVKVSDAIIVGTQGGGCRFGDMTIDMFRMVKLIDTVSNKLGNEMDNVPDLEECSRPQKVLLFAPATIQLLNFATAAMTELGDNAALLVYLSAPGVGMDQSSASEQGQGDLPEWNSGILLPNPKPKPMLPAVDGAGAVRDEAKVVVPQPNKKQEAKATKAAQRKAAKAAKETERKTASEKREARTERKGEEEDSSPPLGEMTGGKRGVSLPPVPDGCVSPEDLRFLLRRPLVLIVESPGAGAFRRLPFPNPYSQPVLCLMSPVDIPRCDASSSSSVSGTEEEDVPGGLLTLFLSNPIVGFAVLVGQSSKMAPGVVDVSLVRSTRSHIIGLLKETQVVTDGLGALLDDSLCASLLSSFVLCRACYALHERYRSNPSLLPQSLPEIPSSVLLDSAVTQLVLSMASSFGVRRDFVEEL